MEKIDLKKQLKALYKASAKPAVVEVPSLNCLMIDGRGNPNTSPQFQQAIQALYSLSYTMKFASKKAGGPDWTVMGLEGLWWTNQSGAFDMGRSKKDWLWTLFIVQPKVVTAKMLTQTVKAPAAKKDNPALAEVRLEQLKEGRCAQVLHVGPYDAEGPTTAALHEFITAGGHKPHGKHHEIYLSDARRVPPERLKTILRQPIT